MEKQAIIQISTSDIRFLLLEITDGGYYNILDEFIQAISIGNDVKQDGLMKANSIKEAINILKMYRRVCDINGVTKTVTVADSFLNNAKNQRGFIEEIYNSCGFVLQTLDKEEEMRAVCNSIINTTDVPKGIIFYIGDSCSYLIQYNRRNIINNVILPFGSMFLAEKFAEEGSLNSENILNFVDKELNKIEFIHDLEAETQIVCAGKIFADIGRIARKATHYSLNIENNYILYREVFNNVYSVIKGLELDNTKRIKGIQEKRLDILLSGIEIARSFIEKTNIGCYSLNSNDLREGLIYNYIVDEINDKPLSEMLAYSLENHTKFNVRYKSNSEHVYTLAMLLFKQLKVMHKLPRLYVKPLRIAATLFESGSRISFENKINTSFDAILNATLSGVSQKEILLAAFACKSQEVDNIGLAEWLKYKDILNDEDLEAVKKIGILVKLASALDASRTSAIPDISCDILGDSVIMKILSTDNFDLEVAEALKVNQSFKKIFKKYLQII